MNSTPLSKSQITKYEIKSFFDNCVIALEDILKDKQTSNIQLEKIGYIYIPQFRGVFSSNNIPTLKHNESCIINTDSDRYPGMHWCALKKYNNKTYFYDSYSRSYKNLSYFWKHKRWIDTKHDVEESIYGKTCGHLCLAWIITFNKYKLKCIGVV
jgi:hypothetical protein